MTDEARPPRPVSKAEAPELDPGCLVPGGPGDTDLRGLSAALRRWIAGPGGALLCRDILQSYHRLQTLLKARIAGEAIHPDSLATARAEFRIAVARAMRRKLEANGELRELKRALCGGRQPPRGDKHSR